MRALYIVHAPLMYGTFFRAYELAKGIAKEGNSVDLVCSERLGSNIRPEMAPGLRIITSKAFRQTRDYPGELFRGFSNAIASFSDNYDFVHAFTCSQPSVWIPGIANVAARRKVFVDWDDLWTGGWANSYGSAVRLTMSGMEGSLPRVARGVTVASAYLFTMALRTRVPREKIMLLTNGSDPEAEGYSSKSEARSRLSLEPNGLYICCVAQMLSGSTLLKTLRFFRSLGRTEPSCRLLLVGSQVMDPQTRNELATLGESVKVLGTVPTKVARLAMSASDALLLMMDDTDYERARWPIRLGDYLAAGRPIVSNAVGEVRRVVTSEDCGLVSQVDDVDGLAKEAAAALEDQKELDRMGTNARGAASGRYSWSKISADLARFYEES